VFVSKLSTMDLSKELNTFGTGGSVRAPDRVSGCIKTGKDMLLQTSPAETMTAAAKHLTAGVG
jgi:hypothetical protein